MKTLKRKQDVSVTLGELETKSFGIETENGVIFDILRNKMYSNKIGAVAREIASNSRDANRENKKTDVPIKISIVEPNTYLMATVPQIVFEDEGIGITPDRMDTIFLLYGASTKRNTNRQTGGFGLGAKTPFAYNDTFTVVTTCNWKGKIVEFTYTASIADKGGKGSGEMVLFNQVEQPVGTPTGTKIIVPIFAGDRHAFEHEVLRTTAFWKVRPTLIGFINKPYEFKTIKKHTGFVIVKDIDDVFHGEGNFLLLIDGIPYKADANLLSLSTNALTSDQHVLFEFKTGELNIAASREAVEYDRATTLKILWKYRALRHYLTNEVNTYFAKSTSWLDACIRANNLRVDADNYDDGKLTEEDRLRAKAYRWLVDSKGHKFIYDNRQVTKVCMDLHCYDIIHYTKPADGTKLEGASMKNRPFDKVWSVVPMYWMDGAKRDAKKNATLFEHATKSFILITETPAIEPKMGKDAVNKDIVINQLAIDNRAVRKITEKAYLDGLGIVIGKYTEVERAKIETVSNYTYYKQTNEVSVKVRRGSTNAPSGLHEWESTEIVFLRDKQITVDGELYIYHVIENLTAIRTRNDCDNWPSSTELYKARIAANLLKRKIVIVGENKAEWFKNAAGMLTIVEAWDQIKVQIKDILEEVEKARVVLETRGHFSDDFKRIKFGNLSADLKEVLYKKVVVNNADYNTYHNLITHDIRKELNLTIQKPYDENKLLEQLQRTYPMVDNYRWSLGVKKTQQYVNLVDAAIKAGLIENGSKRLQKNKHRYAISNAVAKKARRGRL